MRARKSQYEFTVDLRFLEDSHTVEVWVTVKREGQSDLMLDLMVVPMRDADVKRMLDVVNTEIRQFINEDRAPVLI